MYFQIRVPVKLYVKDYYENAYGNPVFASKNNIVGILTEPCLQKTPASPVFVKTENPLIINLSWSGDKEGYKDARVFNYLSPNNQKLLSKLLEKTFWNVFYAYMDANIYSAQGIKIKTKIEEFITLNNIDPMNGSLEMFTKAYYRYTRKSFGDSSAKQKIL